MTVDDVLRLLLEWFGHAGTACLKLPIGWFGRPHDNLLRLTAAHSYAGRLIVVLDDQAVLVLAHPSHASVDGTTLSISGFSHGVWDWDEYGSNRPHQETFEGGAVEFVASGPLS